jgi:hypothetical protein
MIEGLQDEVCRAEQRIKEGVVEIQVLLQTIDSLDKSHREQMSQVQDEKDILLRQCEQLKREMARSKQEAAEKVRMLQDLFK